MHFDSSCLLRQIFLKKDSNLIWNKKLIDIFQIYLLEVADQHLIYTIPVTKDLIVF